jgi:hypothetical protein
VARPRERLHPKRSAMCGARSCRDAWVPRPCWLVMFVGPGRPAGLGVRWAGHAWLHDPAPTLDNWREGRQRRQPVVAEGRTGTSSERRISSAKPTDHSPVATGQRPRRPRVRPAEARAAPGALCPPAGPPTRRPPIRACALLAAGPPAAGRSRVCPGAEVGALGRGRAAPLGAPGPVPTGRTERDGGRGEARGPSVVGPAARGSIGGPAGRLLMPGPLVPLRGELSFEPGPAKRERAAWASTVAPLKSPATWSGRDRAPSARRAGVRWARWRPPYLCWPWIAGAGVDPKRVKLPALLVVAQGRPERLAARAGWPLLHTPPSLRPPPRQGQPASPGGLRSRPARHTEAIRLTGAAGRVPVCLI